jgi:NitT/TauT family transport system ATP-binding protein
MARRVAFARALAFQPDILLLDEPFASLDDDWVERMRAMILAARDKSDIPIAIATHNKADAIALDAQTLVLTGSPAELQPAE